jgi:hypothetical protein
MQDPVFDDATLFEVLLDRFARALFIHATVPDAVRIDDHQGAAPALVQAIDLCHHDTPAQIVRLESAFQLLQGAPTTLPTAGLTCANEHMSI